MTLRLYIVVFASVVLGCRGAARPALEIVEREAAPVMERVKGPVVRELEELSIGARSWLTKEELPLIVRASVRASAVATRVVEEVPLSLVLYDSSGKPIVYANGSENSEVYKAATQAFRSEVSAALDSVADALDQLHVPQATDLDALLVAKHVAPYLKSRGQSNGLDRSTAQITLRVSFGRENQAEGEVNMYELVQRVVELGVVSGGGYIITKRKT